MAKSAPKLEGVDLFGFDAMLSDDERAVKTQMRAFVEKEILPTIGKHFAAGTFPKHLIRTWASWAAWGRTSSATAARG